MVFVVQLVVKLEYHHLDLLLHHHLVELYFLQKQVRDLNKHTNMGLGGIKVLLIVGAVVGAIWTLMKIMGGR